MTAEIKPPWRPIETAPIGVPVIVMKEWHDDRLTSLTYGINLQKHKGAWQHQELPDPTHWLPIDHIEKQEELIQELVAALEAAYRMGDFPDAIIEMVVTALKKARAQK